MWLQIAKRGGGGVIDDDKGFFFCVYLFVSVLVSQPMNLFIE